MKSYTDLEQSRKLAKILPIESADGYWFKGFPSQPYMVYTKGTPNPGEHIPCWSLAALLDALPDYTLTTNSDRSVFGMCESKKPMISDTYNNPLDAVFEIIIKFYDKNFL
jgi:hypothetical protein